MPIATIRVAVVVPNWNGATRLGELLQRLRDQSRPIDRVIMVDNGSTDNSAELAGAAGAQVIKLDTNTGFSHAVNMGIQAADTDWIVIINNDVTPERDWLAKLLSAATEPDIWFATGKLLDAGDHARVDGAFDAICRGACAWRCGNGREDSPIWNQARKTYFAPFTAALFRAELFRRVGLLDEDFESYLEDIDFGLRCAGEGFSGVYVPGAVAYHTGSATFGRWHPDTVRKIARNQLLLVAKHYPSKWVLRYGWPILVAQTLWGFIALRHGTALAFLRGKLEGLQGFRRLRRTPAANFPSTVEQSESDIRELQQLTGFDLYWKLYFALT